MNHWKIVSQIASGFGIVFIVFAVFAAFINYEAITLQSSLVSASSLQIYILNAMLPFLLYSVLSFIVAGVTMRSSREKKEMEMQPTMPEPQPETPTEENKQ
jgi:uncharacterized membrane protein YesL